MGDLMARHIAASVPDSDVCARIERLAGAYRYPIAASRPFYSCVTIRRM